jgi:molybdenum cofactor biosynthesis enzyme MoaA
VPGGPQKNEKKDKRLRAGRSRQKHLNRWQEDQIPPASRSFFAACSRIRIWKEGIYHTLMSRASFLVRARWPGMSQVASRPSTAYHHGPGSPPDPTFPPA